MSGIYSHPTLFDLPAAIISRDQAIAAAAIGAPSWWKTAASSALIAVASRSEEFTSDDIWEELHAMGIPAPNEPRAMGAIISEAVTRRLITATDRVQVSHRPICHGRKIQVWRSLCRITD